MTARARRAKSKPADPEFAAELARLEAERHERWVAEHNHPATTSGTTLPPVAPAVYHSHVEDCFEDSGRRIWQLPGGSTWVVGRLCQATGQPAIERVATRQEIDEARRTPLGSSNG